MLIHQDLHILPITLQAKHYLMHLQLYITAPLLLCCAIGWGGWLVPDRYFQHLHSWHAGKHVGTLQLSLPALRTPCTKQARRQDSLPNQAQSPSALSRILIPASVTSTVHVAELGLHLCTVKHVQAVRAWGQYFALSLSCQSWHKAVVEVPFRALKSYGVLNVCRLQQLHLLGDKITALCLLQLWAGV